MVSSLLFLALCSLALGDPILLPSGTPEKLGAATQGYVAYLEAQVTGSQIYRCFIPPGSATKRWDSIRPEVLISTVDDLPIGYSNQGGPILRFYDGSVLRVTALVSQPSPNGTQNLPWVWFKTNNTGLNGQLSYASNLMRLNTVGGVAPALTQCTRNLTLFSVPFSATYYFYRPDSFHTPSNLPSALKEAVPEEDPYLVLKAQGFRTYKCQENDGELVWNVKGTFGDLWYHGNYYVPVATFGPEEVWNSTGLNLDGSNLDSELVEEVRSPNGIQNLPWQLWETTPNTHYGQFAESAHVLLADTNGGQSPSRNECTREKLQTVVQSPFTANYYFYQKTADELENDPEPDLESPEYLPDDLDGVTDGFVPTALYHAFGLRRFVCNKTKTESFWTEYPMALLYNGSYVDFEGSMFLLDDTTAWQLADGSTLSLISFEVTAKSPSILLPALDWAWMNVSYDGPEDGEASSVVYILRYNTEGGIAPPLEECSKNGLVVDITFKADYMFFEVYIYDGLTPAQIAGIVLGSVFGALIILGLLAFLVSGGAGGLGGGGEGGSVDYSSF